MVIARTKLVGGFVGWMFNKVMFVASVISHNKVAALLHICSIDCMYVNLSKLVFYSL